MPTKIRPLYVLIVDDMEDTRETYTTLFSHCGHRVIAAANAYSGLKVAEAEMPDVIVTDLLLPAMTGWEFAVRVKELKLGRRPFVIVVSGQAGPAARERSVLSGVDVHLAKPADQQVLMAVLDTVHRLLAANGAKDGTDTGHTPLSP